MSYNEANVAQDLIISENSISAYNELIHFPGNGSE